MLLLHPSSISTCEAAVSRKVEDSLGVKVGTAGGILMTKITCKPESPPDWCQENGEKGWSLAEYLNKCSCHSEPAEEAQVWGGSLQMTNAPAV